MLTTLLFILVIQVNINIAQNPSSPHLPSQNNAPLPKTTPIWINVKPVNDNKERLNTDPNDDNFNLNSPRSKSNTENIKRHNTSDILKINLSITQANGAKHIKDPIKLYKNGNLTNFAAKGSNHNNLKKEVPVEASKYVFVNESDADVGLKDNNSKRRILWSKINTNTIEYNKLKNATEDDEDMEPLVLKTKKKDYGDDDSLVLNSERGRYSEEYEDSLGPLAIKPKKRVKDLSAYGDVFRPLMKPKQEEERKFIDHDDNYKPLALNPAMKSYNNLDVVSKTPDYTKFKLTDPIKLGPDSYLYGILLINHRVDNVPNYRLNAGQLRNKRTANNQRWNESTDENSLKIKNGITSDNKDIDRNKKNINYHTNEAQFDDKKPEYTPNDPTNKVIDKPDTLLNVLKLFKGKDIPNFQRTHKKRGKGSALKLPFVVLNVFGDDSMSDEDTLSVVKQAIQDRGSFYLRKVKDNVDPDDYDYYKVPLPLKAKFPEVEQEYPERSE